MNDYDRIMKETLKDAIDALVDRVFGIPVSTTHILPVDLTLTDERRPDFLLQVDAVHDATFPTTVPFIVHVELQTANDSNMHHRMLRYYSIIAGRWKLPVYQYLLYLGSTACTMKDHIADSGLDYCYSIINMSLIDANTFLYSEKPEEIVLSVLCAPENGDSRLTIQTLLHNIKQKAESELAFSKYCRQLGVLVQLRDTGDILKEEEQKMSFTFDINKDPHFMLAKEMGMKEGIEEGMQKGMQKGIQKGRVEGLNEGIARGKSETAVRMIMEGFEMPVISRITGLSMDEIELLKRGMH